MNKASKTSRLAAQILCFAAPFPLTWFFASLVVCYWNYFDMGISGARAGVALFLYCPIALASFLIIGTIVFLALRHRGTAPWIACTTAIAGMIVALVTAFSYEVYRTIDYPVDPPDVRHRLGEFLVWFARSWF